MTHRVILDCDPGVDDAIAIALAVSDPNVSLVALSAVSGNAPLLDTARNARAIRDYLGVDVPVWEGASAPLSRPAVHAPLFHGENGLANRTLEPAAGTEGFGSGDRTDGVAAIIETLRANPGEIDLVAVGPLTNIALALQAEPRVAEWARSLSIMGGAFTGGNVTAVAEFNIYADPEAASVVFNANWTPVLAGLDVTMHAPGTLARLGDLFTLGEFSENFLHPMMTFAQTPDGDTGCYMHDSVALAALTRPDLFESRPARLDVELDGTFTLGQTVCEFRSTEPNATVLTRIDADGFWDYLRGALSALAEERV